MDGTIKLWNIEDFAMPPDNSVRRDNDHTGPKK